MLALMMKMIWKLIQYYMIIEFLSICVIFLLIYNLYIVAYDRVKTIISAGAKEFVFTAFLTM